MSQLTTLLPAIKTVIINEGTDKAEVLNIEPFKYKQFYLVSANLMIIKSSIKGEDLDLLNLVATNGEEIGKIISIACNKPEEWVDKLDLTEVVKLAGAIVEVNRDFFFQRLAPTIRALKEKLMEKETTGEE